jgi:hypothetical protein
MGKEKGKENNLRKNLRKFRDAWQCGKYARRSVDILCMPAWSNAIPTKTKPNRSNLIAKEHNARLDQ